jgi:hypothetical protein
MASLGRNFAYMSDSLGANEVRIIIQYNKYMSSITQPNYANIALLKQVADSAKKYNIHLIITGLGANRPADQPAWYTNLSDSARWVAQANYWSVIAGALANNPTIFSYDLANEPVVNSGNSALTSSNWAADGSSDTSADWYGQYITRQPYPGSTNGVNNWEAPMHKWIKQLTAAIRAVDAATPITAGMLNLPPFADFTTDLDYASLHLYVKNDQAGISSIAQYTSNKPLLIEETWPAWLSGLDAPQLATFVESEKPAVTGWVSQFFGKTIQQYASEHPEKLDDVNTQNWFQECQTIAPFMKTP